ncbi:hypothetical protein HOO65_050393 [Ceratocystis lukuohia]|uniref:Uncharacterized protein n=1 Tax=Ceratocystis lukuohia TaxID=2019550 RepID=A0ABR4MG64_9PEZI
MLSIQVIHAFFQQFGLGSIEENALLFMRLQYCLIYLAYLQGCEHPSTVSVSFDPRRITSPSCFAAIGPCYRDSISKLRNEFANSSRKSAKSKKLLRPLAGGCKPGIDFPSHPSFVLPGAACLIGSHAYDSGHQEFGYPVKKRQETKSNFWPDLEVFTPSYYDDPKTIDCVNLNNTPIHAEPQWQRMQQLSSFQGQSSVRPSRNVIGLASLHGTCVSRVTNSMGDSNISDTPPPSDGNDGVAPETQSSMINVTGVYLSSTGTPVPQTSASFQGQAPLGNQPYSHQPANASFANDASQGFSCSPNNPTFPTHISLKEIENVRQSEVGSSQTITMSTKRNSPSSSMIAAPQTTVTTSKCVQMSSSAESTLHSAMDPATVAPLTTQNRTSLSSLSGGASSTGFTNSADLTTNRSQCEAFSEGDPAVTELLRAHAAAKVKAAREQARNQAQDELQKKKQQKQQQPPLVQPGPPQQISHMMCDVSNCFSAPATPGVIEVQRPETLHRSLGSTMTVPKAQEISAPRSSAQNANQHQPTEMPETHPDHPQLEVMLLDGNRYAPHGEIVVFKINPIESEGTTQEAQATEAKIQQLQVQKIQPPELQVWNRGQAQNLHVQSNALDLNLQTAQPRYVQNLDTQQWSPVAPSSQWTEIYDAAINAAAVYATAPHATAPHASNNYDAAINAASVHAANIYDAAINAAAVYATAPHATAPHATTAYAATIYAAAVYATTANVTTAYATAPHATAAYATATHAASVHAANIYDTAAHDTTAHDTPIKSAAVYATSVNDTAAYDTTVHSITMNGRIPQGQVVNFAPSPLQPTSFSGNIVMHPNLGPSQIPQPIGSGQINNVGPTMATSQVPPGTGMANRGVTRTMSQRDDAGDDYQQGATKRQAGSEVRFITPMRPPRKKGYVTPVRDIL